MAQPEIDVSVLAWAVEELRGLDEACRSMIPGFDSWNSTEMDKIHYLERYVKNNKESSRE